VRDVEKVKAALVDSGIATRSDFDKLDTELRQELDAELKAKGISIGDRAKLKTEQSGVKVQQGNGEVNVLMLQVGEAMQVPKLERVFVGLGWNQYPGTAAVDIDASCIGFSRGNPSAEKVYFKSLRNSNRSLVHSGDVLSGKPSGLADLERIYVWISTLPTGIDCLVFLANIYSPGTDFAQLSDAYIRMVNADTNQELSRARLAGAGLKGNALVFAKLYRTSSEGAWQFLPLGMPLTVPGCSSLDDMVPLLLSSGSAVPPTVTATPVSDPVAGAETIAPVAPEAKPAQKPTGVYLAPALAVATVGGIAAATAIFYSDLLTLDMVRPSNFETGVDFTSLVPSGDTLDGVDDLLPMDAFASTYDWAGGVTEGVTMDSIGDTLGEAVGSIGDGLGAAGEAVAGLAGDAVEAAPSALASAGEALGNAGGEVAEFAGDAGDAVTGVGGAVIAKATGEAASAGAAITGAGGAVIAEAPGAIASAGDTLTQVGGDLVGFASNVASQIAEAAPGVIDAVKNMGEQLGGVAASVADAIGPALG